MSEILSMTRHPKGTLRSFGRAIEVLDFGPREFCYPQAWVFYVNASEKRMKRTLDSTQADDLCDCMFDADIETAARDAKSSADQQHTAHLGFLWKRARILAGKLSAVRSFRNDLLNSLSELETEIRRLESQTKL